MRTTGVLVIESSEGLEKLGMGRKEISSFYIQIMKGPMRWVTAMKTAYFGGFSAPEESD